MSRTSDITRFSLLFFQINESEMMRLLVYCDSHNKRRWINEEFIADFGFGRKHLT
jgi:hypothetical protein